MFCVCACGVWCREAYVLPRQEAVRRLGMSRMSGGGLSRWIRAGVQAWQTQSAQGPREAGRDAERARGRGGRSQDARFVRPLFAFFATLPRAQ